MPIYEYKCLKCDKPFEVNRSIDDAAATAKCPSCGSTETERMYSTVYAKTSRKS